jgi:cytosine deaminase
MSLYYDLLIQDAIIDSTGQKRDIGIQGSRIVAMDHKLDPECSQELLCGQGCFLTPGLIDAHVHLDKAYLGGADIWRNQTLIDGKNLITEKSLNLTENLEQRARRALQTALKKGTTFLRTHIDLSQNWGVQTLKMVLALKTEVQGWMDLQSVAFLVDPSFAENPALSEHLLAEALEAGADLVGGLPTWIPLDKRSEYMDMLFRVAQRFDRDIDLHIDESNDPADFALELLADKTLEYGWHGRVVASHACSLRVVDPKRAARVIDKLAQAKIMVITNPLTNLYLRGSNGQPNGLTPVSELLSKGIVLTYATDNSEDMFNPLGNLDLLLAGQLLAYQTSLSPDFLTAGSIPELIFKLATEEAAKVVKVDPPYGLKIGSLADLVIWEGSSPAEVWVNLLRPRYVLKGGKVVLAEGKMI